LTTDHSPEPLWKQDRKEKELALASAVCVASSFTRSTLPDSALERPVFVIPYGFPTQGFTAKSEAPDGQFVALSVGAQSVQKGTHYLLHAWKRAGLKDAKLRLLGPLRLSRPFLAEFEGLFEHVPYLPKARLGAEYRAADLLIFPTLADGFGLVIQEAMSSGTPVLTTPCGGGPECISSGEEGWIVPPRDVDALVEALRAAAANRDRLFRMGQAARRRAEGWTWDDAGQKLVQGLAAHSLL
jgi:glycosyltransferase involved in cell wall biosynthesis